MAQPWSIVKYIVALSGLALFGDWAASLSRPRRRRITHRHLCVILPKIGRLRPGWPQRRHPCDGSWWPGPPPPRPRQEAIFTTCP